MSEVLAVRGPEAQLPPGRTSRSTCCAASISTCGQGEIVALLGPSGSGKSTLLQAVGLLEGGFEGSIRIAGEEAAELDDDDRTRLRRDTLGFVYQFHHLLPDFTRARECGPAAADPRREPRGGATSAPRTLLGDARPRRSGSTHRPSAACRAASSSASPSPARSPTARRWSSPTSPPAISTRRPPTSSSPNSSAWSATRAAPPGRHPQRAHRREDGPGAAAARGRAGVAAARAL